MNLKKIVFKQKKHSEKYIRPFAKLGLPIKQYTGQEFTFL